MGKNLGGFQTNLLYNFLLNLVIFLRYLSAKTYNVLGNYLKSESYFGKFRDKSFFSFLFFEQVQFMKPFDSFGKEIVFMSI